MTAAVPSLLALMSEAKERLEEFSRASYQNADDALQRYYHVLRPETAIGSLLASLLPAVDFDAWHSKARATQGGMVGSAKLRWPAETPERVALQLELVRRMANGEIDTLDFAHTFTYAGSRYDDMLRALFERVLMPFHNDLVRIFKPYLEKEEKKIAASPAEPLPYRFIDRTRLDQIKAVDSKQFDLVKVARLCEEMDFCFRNECHFAVAALTRALLDHVPPIFGMKTFAEVANNYSGSRSFKESMRHLELSARNIGDAHLHTQVRAKESLPTATQVNFANDIDVLLSEIVRILT
jgi:hypothetical protein